MGEHFTRELPDGRSFEERVFARFDGMDARYDGMDAQFNAMNARFDGMDVRLDRLDLRIQALEARALDTKPIWERALTEILEVRKGVEDLDRKLDVLNQDVLQVRADQRRIEKRMNELESRVQ